MKTAVSIPDHLFAAADRLATQRGMSRSELYARALERYLAGASDEEITEQLNAVYADVDSRLDPDIAVAQAEILERDPW